ncbi:hypothetical protein [Erwinia rhapontici]|uniref:hypothetical protein n=1 Tax=Erwinia rhapontici TaxID=55212 RepID=UPI003B9DDABB
MINKTALLIAIAALTTDCSPHQPKQQRSETPECRTWRTMMTAPLAPDAYGRLKADCEKSMGDGDGIRPD